MPDLLVDIDQQLTSATVRADAESATLREKPGSSQLAVSRTSFSCATGAVENFDDMYRVHVLDDGKPEGVFRLELADPGTISVLSFDTVSTPGEPSIAVEVSADQASWTPARTVSKNGYRITAWFDSARAKYVRISITPSMPDTIGGSTYTFGITSV